MRISAVLCTIALLAAQSVATFADSHMGGSGFYGSIGGGAVLVGDSKKSKASVKGAVAGVEVVFQGESDWAFDFGFGVQGAVGYDFGDFRTDVEAVFLSASFDATPAGEVNKNADNGSLSVFGGVASVWYDIDTGTAWSPYLGAGAGGANISAKITAPGDKSDVIFSGSGWAFAYQGGAGVQYQLTDSIALDLGYRLFGAISAKVKETDKDEETDVTVTTTFEPKIMSHRATLGVKVSF